MRKLYIVAIVAILVLALCVAVLAVTSPSVFSFFHQTLTVPFKANLAMFLSDDTTPITNGSLVTTPPWVWTGTQFDLTIIVHNTGFVDLTTSMTLNPSPANWVVTASGLGFLPIGLSQTVNIKAVPPNPITSGNATGDFEILINGN